MSENKNETYVCTNAGKEYFFEGHLSTEDIEAKLTGEKGAYAWLEDCPYHGQASAYNGTFGRGDDYTEAESVLAEGGYERRKV